MLPLSESELHELVARVVRRTLGQSGALTDGGRQPAGQSSGQPAAGGKQASAAASAQPLVAGQQPAAGRQVVAIGADHGGYALKEDLKAFVAGLGYAVIDCGTHSADPVDYPDLAYAVARLVSAGEAWRGILVDGAGIGSAIAANKVPGVRAALCYDHATAVNSREHNDANVLTLGAGLVGANLARQITQTWLATAHAGGRHQRRVDKIGEIEKRFLKNGA